MCSRREADREIAFGHVMINGRIACLGDRAEPGDEVLYLGKPVIPAEKKTILAFYKPVGIVVTEERREKDNLMDFLKLPKRLTYLGRLDKDSEGLLLLSDDGDLAHSLMQGRNKHEKEYEVTVNRPLTKEFLRSMEEGVYLKELSQRTRPCRARRLSERSFSLVLTQGLNRQIRRMCEAFGYRVTRLKRIRIENIVLGDLKSGEYRELTSSEEKELRRRLSEKHQNLEGAGRNGGGRDSAG